MTYKLLLLGNNEAAIDDFFGKMESHFELQTTSTHFNDIKCHIKYFSPDAIVYCMNHENEKVINNIMALKQKAIGALVPFIILGNTEDVDKCMKQGESLIDFVLTKPINATGIVEGIVGFLDKREIRMKALAKQAEEEELRLDRERQTAGMIFNQTTEIEKVNTSDSKTHILVVDDDIRMCKVIKKYLEDDYHVATAVSGKIALRYLETKPADLILLDYVMPDLDGPGVLAALHSNPATKDIPVIFLTGATEREQITKALALKPQGYILKPVEREALVDKINSVLAKKA